MRDDDIDIDDIGDGDLPDILYDYTMFRDYCDTYDSDDMDPPYEVDYEREHPGELGEGSSSAFHLYDFFTGDDSEDLEYPYPFFVVDYGCRKLMDYLVVRPLIFPIEERKEM